jgi:hypothetical protein
MPALVTGHHIEPFGEKVDHLSLAFIAPLRAQYDYIAYVAHDGQTHSFYRM